MYYSHNSNIKHIASTIKYISFELIHYVIILNVVSSSMVCNDFDYILLSMYQLI